MKDINFFSTYIEKKKIKFNNSFFLSVIFLIFFMWVLGYGLINQLKINRISQEIFELQMITEDPQILKKVKEIAIKEKELNSLRSEVKDIKKIKIEIEREDFIDFKYINNIIRKKPKDLFLTNFEITSEYINIIGISNNKLNIANFLKGIQSLNGFEDAFISNISKVEIDYKFQLENEFSKQINGSELIINEQGDLENEKKD